MTTAVYFFWHILNQAQGRKRWGVVAGFGVCLAATFYIYLAARVAWVLFPTFLVYLALFHRPQARRAWRGVGLGLLLTGLLVAPMFWYLRQNPQAQPRLSMLSRPLEQMQSGNLLPVLQNSWEALLAFVWPGYGDQFLAYNIPGRPVLTAATAVFFLLGIVVCLWRWQRPSFAFLLFWFVTGIIPSLITGPTANTTRNLAALPAVYLLPAVGLATLARQLAPQWGSRTRLGVAVAAAVWLLIAGGITVRDYFGRWGQAAAVRGAYQHNLVTALSHLQGQSSPPETLVVSSVYPGPAHDYSISLVLAAELVRSSRWVDARRALIRPSAPDVRAIIPASTPPHPSFAPLLQPQQTVELRPDDLDPSFTVYEMEPLPPNWVEDENGRLANVNNAVELKAVRWLQESVRPGETAELMTLWHVTDPARVGPVVPPAAATDVALFVHVLGPQGDILALHDGLDAPSWSWRAGDWVVQIHPMTVPPATAVGAYRTITGIYDKASGERIPVVNEQGDTIADHVAVGRLVVTTP